MIFTLLTKTLRLIILVTESDLKQVVRWEKVIMFILLVYSPLNRKELFVHIR